MNTNSLYYFQVLANELHFGNAAKKLHISQPPLSRAIKQLEQDLGMILFERNSRKVLLTPAGEYLRQRANVILKNIHETEKEIKLIAHGERGQLHITSVASILHVILPFVNAFVNTHPLIRFKISHYTTLEQIQLVRSNEADIAFVRTPIHTEGLQLFEIFREHFVLITPANINLSINTQSDLKQLSKFAFISFPRYYAQGLHDQIIHLCNMAEYSPNITHEAYQLNTIVRMVESGLGITILPASSLVGLKLNVKTFNLDFMPQRSAISCYYNDKNENKALKLFIQECITFQTGECKQDR